MPNFIQKRINLFIHGGLISLFFLVVFLLVGNFAYAQSSPNAGMVKGIWYSQFPFFSGDKIKINLAIQNQTSYDMVGRVQFYDYNLLIGESDFSADDGKLIVAQIEYEFADGKHKISAKLTDVKKSEFGKTAESIVLKLDSLEDDEMFVDMDIDGDGVGNLKDFDDDDDDLDDKKEAGLGTNPLSSDSDNDGARDGEEVKQGTSPLVSDRESGDEKDTGDSFVLGAFDEADNIIKKTDDFFKEVAGVIQEKENAIQEGAKKEKNTEPIISEASITTIERIIPSVKTIKERIPAKEDVKSLLLKITIFILRNWWLVMVIILFLVIWMINKKRNKKRRT